MKISEHTTWKGITLIPKGTMVKVQGWPWKITGYGTASYRLKYTGETCTATTSIPFKATEYLRTKIIPENAGSDAPGAIEKP